MIIITIKKAVHQLLNIQNQNSLARKIIFLAFLGSFFLSFCVSANLTDGLVAYYEFSGDAQDLSGNGNHATVYSATLTADRFANPGSAYVFNGAYNRTINNSVGNLGTSATISFWVNPDKLSNASSSHRIIEKDYAAYWSIMFDGGRLAVYLRGSNSLGPPEAALYGPLLSDFPSGWSSVVLRKNDGLFELLVNGNLVSSVNTSISSITPQYNMSLGHSEYWHTQGQPQYFYGSIDSVRIYNRMLSDSEVSVLSTSNPLNNGLVAYYPFNGNANDESVNANHGTVNGATLTTDRFGNPDSAYNFDGNDFINASANDLPTRGRTVSLWFYANSVFQPVLLGYGGSGACGTSYFMGINARPSIYQNRFYTSSHCNYNNLYYNYSEPPVCRWYHWVATVNGSEQSIYIDGIKVSTNNSFTSPTYVAGRQLAIGVATSTSGVAPYVDANVTYFNGKLDDVRIYDRALSETEVLQLYNESPTTTVGDLLQLQSSYQFSLDQSTQSSFALDLANRDSVAHEATIELLNPFDNLIVTHAPMVPTIVGPNAPLPVTLSVDATSVTAGSYDVLLKVTGDDGSTIYSTVTIVVTDPGAGVVPDLSVTARDMVFNPANPAAGEIVTISATVRNSGTTTSSATTVQFWDLGTVLGEVTLDPIAADGVGVASLPVSFPTDGVRLIRVVVDPNEIVNELNEDNNEASQLLQIGASTGAAGNIIVTGSAPSNVIASQLFSFSGHAFYEIIVNGVALRDYVVKGGSVQITIEENTPGGQRWDYGEIHTNIYGDFSYLLQAPTTLGQYKLTMTVTDQTFTGHAVLLFNVIEPTIPPPFPPTGTGGAGSGGGGGSGGTGSWTFNPGGGGGGGSWTWTWTEPPAVDPHNDAFVYSEDVVFSNNNPTVGEEIYIFANIHYWANSTDFVAENVPVNFYVTFPGFEKMLIGSTVIDQLTVGPPDLGSQFVFTSWRNTVGGIYIVEVEIDPSFTDSNPLNNAATRAIIVGDLDTGAIAGHVRDENGPVSDVTLELQDLVGTVLATTQTDNAGGYLFSGLVVGPRQVRVVAPNGYIPDAEIKSADVLANTNTTVDFLLSQLAGPYRPVAYDQQVATDEDVAVNITLTASDLDNDPLTFSIVDLPTHGTLTGSAPIVTYTPDPDYYGSDSFTFLANDGLFDSSIATVSIIVNPVNDPPVAQPDEYSTNEDTALIIAVPGVLVNDSDVDGDTLTAMVVQGPVNGALIFNSDGSFTYKPAANYYGTDSFAYQASDPSGESSNAVVTIVVHPGIDQPIAADDFYTILEDTTLNVVAPGVLSNDIDLDGGSLTAQLLQGPGMGSLIFHNDGLFTYTPATNFTGMDSFTYTATSTSGLSALATVTIEVTPDNDIPIVILGDGAVINEGDTYSRTGLFIDPDTGDSWTATADYGDGSGVQSLTLNGFEFELNHTYVDNGMYTVTVTVSDVMGSGSVQLTVQANNVAPDVGPITAPVDPVVENTLINVSADFMDPGILDTHTAVWDWGDGTTTTGVVSETNGSGSVAGDHAYTSAGVYTIVLTVTDKDGDSGTSQYEFIVVYQLNAGFVTGGGWIHSPPGAYLADPTATGKPNFGFNSKYKKGANVPNGSTEFQFNAGNLNFHSNSYDWLTVAGARAQYKGEGTINGSGVYGFLMTVIDGQIAGGSGTDKLRMKIWDKTSEVVIYDNQLGEANDSQLTTELGGGQIVIHAQ